jgi:hypothetical protein
MTQRPASSFVSTSAAALLIFAVLSGPGAPPAIAASPTTVHGGGTGTFGSDLDGDGDIDGSQFAFTARTEGGDADGRFMCLMAGRSDILGLPIMSVTGPITGGSASGSSAHFSGTARINLGNGIMFHGVPFRVDVREGGPGVGQLELTVIGAFDGVPGDTVLGNGNYDLPPETVRSGGIAVGP